MDIVTTLRTTAAVRAFTDEPVADDVVYELLDDARFGPSGGNRQPWRVAVVKDPVIRHRIGELMQPVWDGYVARAPLGVTPYNCIDDREPAAAPELGLPEHHALAATMFLGVPERQVTRLRREPVEAFARLDRFDGPPFGA